MNDYSRAAKSFDDQIDSAWQAFRERIIADFNDGFDMVRDVDSDEESDLYTNDLTIGVPEGRELTAYVVNPAGEDPVIWIYQTEVTDEDKKPIDISSPESTEAANRLIEVLRDSWGVVHPAFLELSRDLEIADHADLINTLALEVDGLDSDKAQLLDLVRETIDELKDHNFEWANDDILKISTPDGHIGAVMARSKTDLEIWTVLADEIDPATARQVTLELLKSSSPYKFLPLDDSVIMSTFVHCLPFNPSAFLKLLMIHLNATDNIFKDAQKFVTAAEQSAAETAEAVIEVQPNVEIQRLQEIHAAEIARLVAERDSAEHELRGTKISIAQKTLRAAEIHRKVVKENNELLGIVKSLEIELEKAKEQVRSFQSSDENVNSREP